MKTVIVMENISNGGAQRVVANILEGSKDKSQFELIVLTNKLDYEIKGFPKQNITVFDSERMLYSLPRLFISILCARKKNVFSSLFIVDAIVFYLRIFTFPQGKLILRSCNYFSKSYPQKLSLARMLILNAYRNADRIICSTESMKSDYAALDPAIARKTLVIPNPVRLDNIDIQSKQSITHRWFDDPESFVFISVAKLKPQKNLALIIEALSLLDIKAKLIILGKGPQESFLKSLVAEKGLEDRVDFLGFHPNPYPYLRQSDAFLLSSNYEGFPNVLVEAMACKLPIISTDCPSGPSDIIKEGRNGFLVPVGSSLLFSERMNSLMSDKLLRHSIAENNWNDVQQYDTSLITPLFEKALNEWD